MPDQNAGKHILSSRNWSRTTHPLKVSWSPLPTGTLQEGLQSAPAILQDTSPIYWLVQRPSLLMLIIRSSPRKTPTTYPGQFTTAAVSRVEMWGEDSTPLLATISHITSFGTIVKRALPSLARRRRSVIGSQAILYSLTLHSKSTRVAIRTKR